MSFAFHINRRNALIEIEGQGDANFDSFLSLMERLISQPDFQSHYSILANFSAITYVPSFLEIRRFSTVFQKVSRAFRGKVAFVVNNIAQLNAGRFASVIARTIHFKMNVFNNRNSALFWIDRSFEKEGTPQEHQMETLQTKILKIITPYQLSALATVKSDGTPWVRYVTTQADEQMFVRFATPLQSRKIGEIHVCPSVHLTCGCSDLTTAKEWVQIAGKAVVKTDTETKKLFWNHFLTAYFSAPEDTAYAVVEIVPTLIEYFTMESLEPEVLHL